MTSLARLSPRRSSARTTKVSNLLFGRYGTPEFGSLAFVNARVITKGIDKSGTKAELLEEIKKLLYPISARTLGKRCGRHTLSIVKESFPTARACERRVPRKGVPRAQVPKRWANSALKSICSRPPDKSGLLSNLIPSIFYQN